MEILQNLGALPIYFLMFIVLYFFMIRPQLKQTKLHNELIANLKKDDKIIMRDGICGKIIDFIGENKIIIERIIFFIYFRLWKITLFYLKLDIHH